MTTNLSYDLICLGRASVNFYGEQIGSRLEDMNSFKKYLGDCTANVAVGCARLGLRTAMLTAVGNDHFGRFVTEALNHEGIATHQIKIDSTRLTALSFLAHQGKTISPLLFYRENCADTALALDDIDADFIRSAKALFVTGTNFLTPICNESSRKAIIAAKESAIKVVLAIDYYLALWQKKDNIAAIFETLLPLCDLIIGTEEEFNLLGGAKVVQQKTQAMLVVKHEEEGCFVYSEVESGYHQGYKAENYNSLGATHAFIASFLGGWLNGESLGTCCQRGNAAGAIVASRLGCASSMLSFQELEYFIKHQPMMAPDSDHRFEQLHYAVARHHTYQDTGILSFQIADKTIGTTISTNQFWVAKSIDQPGSVPLEFEGSLDLGTTLRQWPGTQTVKCSVTYHPDDRYLLKTAQEESLKHLFSAVRATDHELLIDLIMPKASMINPQTISQVLDRFYELEIYPDWWQIAPPRDKRAWDNITKVIETRDPFCRGILVMVHDLREDQIKYVFEMATNYRVCKGFAIGNLTTEAGEQWLNKEICDVTLIQTVFKQFQGYIDMWQNEKTRTMHVEICEN